MIGLFPVQSAVWIIISVEMLVLSPEASPAEPPPETQGQAAQVSLEQASGETTEGREPFRLSDLGLKGKLTYKNFSHFHDSPNDPRDFRNEAILEMEWDKTFSEWARVNILAMARQDDYRFTQGIRTRIPDNLARRRYLDVIEGALKLNVGSADIALGKQIYAWGTAWSFLPVPLFNPTDNFAPYDYLDVIDRVKLGVYSASLTAPVGPVTVNMIWLPFFTPSRDPLPTTRWTPAAAGAGGVGLDIPKDKQVEQRQVPGRDLDNMMYAIRVKTTVGGWDLSASYFEGFEYVPVVRRDKDPSGGDTFAPVYRHMRVPGFDFSTTSGKFVFNGEFAFKFEDRDIKDTRFQGTLDTKYTWDDLGVKWLDQVEFLFGYIRERFLSSKNPNFIVDGNFINAFRNAIAGGTELKFNEETKFSVFGTMDFEKEANYFTQLKLTHKFTDDLHVESGFDLFAGVRDSFWGKWRDNDRFFFFTKYFF